MCNYEYSECTMLPLPCNRERHEKKALQEQAAMEHAQVVEAFEIFFKVLDESQLDQDASITRKELEQAFTKVCICTLHPNNFKSTYHWPRGNLVAKLRNGRWAEGKISKTGQQSYCNRLIRYKTQGG